MVMSTNNFKIFTYVYSHLYICMYKPLQWVSGYRVEFHKTNPSLNSNESKILIVFYDLPIKLLGLLFLHLHVKHSIKDNFFYLVL